MAVDKLVDSTQLNTDLTAVADAIRTKGGTSGQMAFPTGFVSAVQAIPTGTTPTGTKQISITQNGTTTEDVAAYANAEITVDVQGGGESWSWDDFVNGTFPSGACVLSATNVTTIPVNRFYENKVVTSVDAPGVTRVASSAFRGCANLESVNFPVCTTIGFTTNTGSSSQAFSFINGGKITVMHFPACIYAGGAQNFINVGTANKPVTIVLPVVTLIGTTGFANAQLAALDVGPDYSTINQTLFQNATVQRIILRRSTDLVSLANINAFSTSNFKSGGAGGTIYIPQALYSHLGDGTSLDYKAATNWATIDGYGTITWAQIEGSIYETQYADGTPIT